MAAPIGVRRAQHSMEGLLQRKHCRDRVRRDRNGPRAKGPEGSGAKPKDLAVFEFDEDDGDQGVELEDLEQRKLRRAQEGPQRKRPRTATAPRPSPIPDPPSPTPPAEDSLQQHQDLMAPDSPQADAPASPQADTLTPLGQHHQLPAEDQQPAAQPLEPGVASPPPLISLSVRVRQTQQDRVAELLSKLDSIAHGGSPGLRRQKAVELAGLFAAPYGRSLLYAYASLADRVFDELGACMESTGDDNDLLLALVCCVFFLLKDRKSKRHLKRSVIGAVIRLMRTLERQGGGQTADGKEEGKVALSESEGMGPEGSTRAGSPSGGNGPKFGRRKFAAQRSPIVEQLRALLPADDIVLSVLGDRASLTPGHIALATCHRMLRDPEGEAALAAATMEEIVELARGHTPRASSMCGAGLISRFSSIESESTSFEEDGPASASSPVGAMQASRASADVEEDPGDEGPGSGPWRIKENLRVEGALPVLARLVYQSTSMFAECRKEGTSPEGPRLIQLQLCLDLMESAVFVNNDNQRYLGTFRVPIGGQKSSQPSHDVQQSSSQDDGRSRKRGRAPRDVPLVRVLVELLRHAKSIIDSQSSAHRQAPPVIKKRLPDILISSMRVLVNLTHHNTEAVGHVIEADGVESLLDCFLAYTRGTLVLEILEMGDQLQEAGATSFDGHDLRERESFDVKLLALNTLTNCTEKSLESRCRVAELVVGTRGDTGMFVARRGRQAPSQGKEAFVPAIKFIVQFLLLRIRPFAEQLAKELQPGDSYRPPSQEGSCRDPDESEVFGDRQAEELVLAGYTSLLLACLMRNHPENKAEILAVMPGHSSNLLIRVLKAFLVFQKQVGVLTSMVMDPIVELISELESGIVPCTSASVRYTSSTVASSALTAVRQPGSPLRFHQALPSSPHNPPDLPMLGFKSPVPDLSPQASPQSMVAEPPSHDKASLSPSEGLSPARARPQQPTLVSQLGDPSLPRFTLVRPASDSTQGSTSPAKKQRHDEHGQQTGPSGIGVDGGEGPAGAESLKGGEQRMSSLVAGGKEAHEKRKAELTDDADGRPVEDAKAIKPSSGSSSSCDSKASPPFKRPKAADQAGPAKRDERQGPIPPAFSKSSTVRPPRPVAVVEGFQAGGSRNTVSSSRGGGASVKKGSSPARRHTDKAGDGKETSTAGPRKGSAASPQRQRRGSSNASATKRKPKPVVSQDTSAFDFDED